LEKKNLETYSRKGDPEYIFYTYPNFFKDIFVFSAEIGCTEIGCSNLVPEAVASLKMNGKEIQKENGTIQTISP